MLNRPGSPDSLLVDSGHRDQRFPESDLEYGELATLGWVDWF